MILNNEIQGNRGDAEAAEVAEGWGLGDSVVYDSDRLQNGRRIVLPSAISAASAPLRLP